MDSRFGRSIIIAALILVGLYVAMPYVDRLLYSATTPRAVEPRGNLSELERSTIELFEHTSPSVVQVVGRAGAPEMTPEGEGVQAQTGTGFVWDKAGHIVTNDHVVEGADALAVRFASRARAWSAPHPTTTSPCCWSNLRNRCRRPLPSAVRTI